MRKQPLLAAVKLLKKDEEAKQEVTVSLANNTDISIDAAVATDLSGLDGIFTIKELQKNGTEGSSWWPSLFRFTPEWLRQEFS